MSMTIDTMLAPDGVWYAISQTNTILLPDGRYARRIDFVDCEFYMLEYLNDGLQEWHRPMKQSKLILEEMTYEEWIEAVGEEE